MEYFDILLELFEQQLQEKKDNVAAMEKTLDLLKQAVEKAKAAMQETDTKPFEFSKVPGVGVELKPVTFEKDESQQ